MTKVSREQICLKTYTFNRRKYGRVGERVTIYCIKSDGRWYPLFQQCAHGASLNNEAVAAARAYLSKEGVRWRGVKISALKELMMSNDLSKYAN